MTHPRGEHHQYAKLTAVAVSDIRANYLAFVNGRTLGAFAKKYGVHESTVRDVLSYKSWRHVADN